MSKTARDWWATVWASPMAVMYVAADVPGLARAAMLVDKAATDEVSAAELAELRQLEDRYGLSPKSRRALMWTVADRLDDGPPSSPPKSDRERRLRVIEGGGK